jgi:hypothetical protein
MPASVFWSALTNSMNRIVISPSDFGFAAGLPYGLDRLTPGSPDTTNGGSEIDTADEPFFRQHR